MKARNIMGKIYVSPNAYLGRSETFCELSVVVFKLQFVEQLIYISSTSASLLNWAFCRT